MTENDDARDTTTTAIECPTVFEIAQQNTHTATSIAEHSNDHPQINPCDTQTINNDCNSNTKHPSVIDDDDNHNDHETLSPLISSPTASRSASPSAAPGAPPTLENLTAAPPLPNGHHHHHATDSTEPPTSRPNGHHNHNHNHRTHNNNIASRILDTDQRNHFNFVSLSASSASSSSNNGVPPAQAQAQAPPPGVSLAEFNIKWIASALKEGNYIHKNRVLKTTLDSLKRELCDKQSEIERCEERLATYECDKARNAEIRSQKLEFEQQNRRLCAHIKRLKDDNEKLLAQNQDLHSQSVTQLHVMASAASLVSIATTAPTSPSIAAANGDDFLLPLPVVPIDDGELAAERKDDGDRYELEQGQEHEGEEGEDAQKTASLYIQKERLVKLTGDRSYMTSYQKVIRDPDQKKSHQAYQRKSSMRSVQDENKALKDRVATLIKEMEQLRRESAAQTSDGQSAEFLKKQVDKLRLELDEQRRLNHRMSGVLDDSIASEDTVDGVRQKLAAQVAEFQRMKERYEASCTRSDALAEENVQLKEAREKVQQQMEALKETTRAMMAKAQQNIIDSLNQRKAESDEKTRLLIEVKKLRHRQNREKELRTELKEAQKKLMFSEQEKTSFCKKYKDLKFQVQCQKDRGGSGSGGGGGLPLSEVLLSAASGNEEMEMLQSSRKKTKKSRKRKEKDKEKEKRKHKHKRRKKKSDLKLENENGDGGHLKQERPEPQNCDVAIQSLVDGIVDLDSGDDDDEGDKLIAAVAPAPSSQNGNEEMSPVKYEQPPPQPQEERPVMPSYLPSHPSAMEQQLMNGDWTEPVPAFNGLDDMMHDFDGENLFDEFDDFDAFDPMNDIGDMPDRLPETFSTLQPHDDDPMLTTTTTLDMQTIVDANHHHHHDHHQTPVHVHDNKHENEHQNVSIEGLQASPINEPQLPVVQDMAPMHEEARTESKSVSIQGLQASQLMIKEIPEEDEMPEPNDDEEDDDDLNVKLKMGGDFLSHDESMSPQLQPLMRRMSSNAIKIESQLPSTQVDEKPKPLQIRSLFGAAAYASGDESEEEEEEEEHVVLPTATTATAHAHDSHTTHIHDNPDMDDNNSIDSEVEHILICTQPMHGKSEPLQPPQPAAASSLLAADNNDNDGGGDETHRNEVQTNTNVDHQQQTVDINELENEAIAIAPIAIAPIANSIADDIAPTSHAREHDDSQDIDAIATEPVAALPMSNSTEQHERDGADDDDGGGGAGITSALAFVFHSNDEADHEMDALQDINIDDDSSSEEDQHTTSTAIQPGRKPQPPIKAEAKHADNQDDDIDAMHCEPPLSLLVCDDDAAPIDDFQDINIQDSNSDDDDDIDDDDALEQAPPCQVKNEQHVVHEQYTERELVEPIHPSAVAETNDTSRKRYRYNYTAPDSACMEPQAKRRKIDDSHTIDPTVGVATKSMPMAIAPECIHSQFEDWTQEFCYILEQTDESVIASHSHSIVCRWTFPSNDVDKTNDAKSVAHAILDLLLNQDFAATFDTDDDNEDDDDDGSGGGCGAAAVGFFAENNRTKYLSYLTDLCDILTRLNRFYKSQKKDVRRAVRNVCKKIISQKLFVGQVVFDTHPHKLCFVCGLFSILCNALEDLGSFWRVVLMLMDQCDLDECALLFAVMFECFPQQIADTAFVQSCCKTVMCSHYHTICATLETPTTTTHVDRLRIAKERYQRLMNVVSSQWNTIPVVSAHRNAFMQTQFDQIIAQNASNTVIVDDTTAGVNVTCRGDIRYAVNELIPRVIYPTLLQQFKKQKTNVQIFLIDLWSECVSNVCAVLQTKCHDQQQQQCALIKEPFINVLQQIAMCYMQCDQLVVFPVVVVCCLRHLLAMQTHTALERVITKFVSSDEQLWKFTTNVLKAWKTRIDSLSGKDKLAERKARIAVFMKIIQTVCSRKSYSMEVFQSLKKEHVPK